MTGFTIDEQPTHALLSLRSEDGTNRLTRKVVCELAGAVADLAPKPLIVTGNDRFFSAGADLNEIAALTSTAALEFARMGQALMNAVDIFPAPVLAAIKGYCMGGGLDLALSCDLRIASKHAVFGHRGAALGLITGWGGTQRLPRLVGKARALEMFTAAEKLDGAHALRCGLIDAIADDPVAAALARVLGANSAS
ncbi:MAG: enoyl-CoA hydratase/isomerase family protein [Acidobacteria bacterium]|nr:enoyl-CoA hydratase/isomerase family protein [Acidobacteriota bacterium]